MSIFNSIRFYRASAILSIVLICGIVCGSPARAVEPTTELAESDERFFETRIRPILIEHCYSCHASDAKIVRGELLLDSREGLLRGGESGPSIVPGNADESLLISAIKYESQQMPPQGRLPDTVVSDFVRWINRGAFDPRKETATAPRSRIDPAAARDHWAFQPIDQSVVPPIANEWVHSPIDAFVLDKLNEQGWQPAPAADKYTLIRRATFDLTGLPPSESEVETFLADKSPSSFQRVVDRLLASPHYGQRWGRHWLDLVRYADTNGADENHEMPTLGVIATGCSRCLIETCPWINSSSINWLVTCCRRLTNRRSANRSRQLACW